MATFCSILGFKMVIFLFGRSVQIEPSTDKTHKEMAQIDNELIVTHRLGDRFKREKGSRRMNFDDVIKDFASMKVGKIVFQNRSNNY